MDEQKSENNLEGSSFLGFVSRFLGKCHQKAVKSRILNYVYFCRFQTLGMPTKPSHSKCLRLSFWKPGGHSKLQICHICYGMYVMVGRYVCMYICYVCNVM